MREAIAWLVCLLALLLVTALSFLFAVRQNVRTDLPPQRPSQNETVIPGRSDSTAKGPKVAVVLEEQQCLTCHSIQGKGNPRNPLDGVGSRLTTDELRDWITGRGAAGEKLSTVVRKRKARYAELGEAQMQTLVEELSNLKAGTSAPSDTQRIQK